VPEIFNKFKNPLKNNPFIRVTYTLNKLNKFIKVYKDALFHSSCSNVVHKIECADCDASYVGPTSRCLESRITEHKITFYTINRNTYQIYYRAQN